MSVKIKSVALLLGLSLGVSSAQAATISLVPSTGTVIVGNPIELDLLMDFTDDPTLGGGLDVFYDGGLLDFVSYVPNPLFGDPDFSRIPDDLGNKLEGLAFGDFAGLSGPATVGTLTFDTVAVGTAVFTMDETTNALVGGFVALDGSDQNPEFIGASWDVEPVPVPAAVWLFGSGLLGLIGVARRKT